MSAQSAARLTASGSITGALALPLGDAGVFGKVVGKGVSNAGTSGALLWPALLAVLWARLAAVLTAPIATPLATMTHCFPVILGVHSQCAPKPQVAQFLRLRQKPSPGNKRPKSVSETCYSKPNTSPPRNGYRLIGVLVTPPRPPVWHHQLEAALAPRARHPMQKKLINFP